LFTPILRELILTVTFRAAANLSSGDLARPSERIDDPLFL
jgi:hypothetical protein